MTPHFWTAARYSSGSNLHDHAGAAQVAHHQAEAQRGRVVEGGGGEVDRLRGRPALALDQQRQERVDVLDRLLEPLLGDALGPPGGAGGIEHVGAGAFVGDGLGGLFGDQRLPALVALGRAADHQQPGARTGVGRELRRPLGVLVGGDEDLRAAVLDDVAGLFGREVARDGGVDDPGPVAGPQDLHELEPVLHQDGDALALPHAELAQGLGAAVRDVVELGVGQRLARARHRVGDLVGRCAGVMRRMLHGLLPGPWRGVGRRTPRKSRRRRRPGPGRRGGRAGAVILIMPLMRPVPDCKARLRRDRLPQ